MQIFSYSPFGYEGALVAVEVDLRRGIPAVDVVGLADGTVKESRERMRSAIRNSGFEFPQERVLISLAPADLRKEGSGFDLAIALSVLEAKDRLSGIYSALENEGILVMGELELSGAVRPVRAVHGAASTAFDAGIKKCIVCSENAKEASEVKGMQVCAVNTLREAYEALGKPELFKERKIQENEAFVPEGAVEIDGVLFQKIESTMEYKNVTGQGDLIRGLQIAAAGGHNLLAFGPPGCGKTLSIQMFPALMPFLTVEEAQSTTRIHSLAGILNPNEPLKRIPPFRMPHQTASIEGICGGGPSCRPGEISLAHNGVLFLDEAAEFKSAVLQMLRVPLENGMITLSRAGRSTVYPAAFQLLMATNPCPCGNYGVEGKLCLCSMKSVEQYWRKFSGPLLDRVDIRIAVGSKSGEGEVSEKEIETVKDSENKAGTEVSLKKESLSTEELRFQIARAVRIQRERQGKRNCNLNPQEIEEFCVLDKESVALLEKVAEKKELSQRALASIKKLARTLSDMEGLHDIGVCQVKEAVSLRCSGNLPCDF